jgi:intracellular septation protein
MTQESAPAPAKSGWLNLLVDYGPVLIFFLVYKHFSPADKEDAIGEVLAVIKGTGIFIVAALIALAVSKWKFGKVSPMLWLSTGLIVVFGAMTILLGDPFWIQVKPTVIYLFFGLSLLIGIMRGRPLLKYLLQAAFQGLDEDGWRILSRNWGIFFLALACLNEGFRYYLTFGGWLQTKLYVFLPLSFLFTFAHMPMLLRHGLGEDEKPEVITHPPHE